MIDLDTANLFYSFKRRKERKHRHGEERNRGDPEDQYGLERVCGGYQFAHTSCAALQRGERER
jgi:hypothetical protein